MDVSSTRTVVPLRSVSGERRTRESDVATFKKGGNLRATRVHCLSSWA